MKDFAIPHVVAVVMSSTPEVAEVDFTRPLAPESEGWDQDQRRHLRRERIRLLRWWIHWLCRYGSKSDDVHDTIRTSCLGRR